jgi:hypothetical protein
MMKPRFARNKKTGANTQRSQKRGMRKLKTPPSSIKLLNAQKTKAVFESGKVL